MSGGPGGFAVHAACIRGVEVLPVTVEIDLSGGLPSMTIVGMADTAVMEARSRIRCSLRAAGFDMPRGHITVNLAPGDVRKVGPGFDLPIAVGILAATGQIPTSGLDDAVFVGELALDGRVCPVKGEVAYQLYARRERLRLVESRFSCRTVVDGVEASGLEGIAQLAQGLTRVPEPLGAPRAAPAHSAGDYVDVIGQEIAKRAFVIAAAGGHSLLMVGSPGSGKSMLASRLPGILPALGERELEEALAIHSIAGEPLEGLLAGTRPFRSPHHTVSLAGLVGGGRPVRPGEISLAHRGVLFLDELAEFSVSVLQSLRQPLEEGVAHVVRVEGAFEFPARFQLVAASNPCPCGNLGDPDRPCTCSATRVERYQERLGGPLADRIDMVLAIRRPDAKEIVAGVEGLSTAQMREQVREARAFAAWRGGKGDAPDAAGRLNRLGGRPSMPAESEDALLALARSAHLTGRGIARLARIARTIADLDAAEAIRPEHVREAAAYRGNRG